MNSQNTNSKQSATDSMDDTISFTDYIQNIGQTHSTGNELPEQTESLSLLKGADYSQLDLAEIESNVLKTTTRASDGEVFYPGMFYNDLALLTKKSVSPTEELSNIPKYQREAEKVNREHFGNNESPSTQESIDRRTDNTESVKAFPTTPEDSSVPSPSDDILNLPEDQITSIKRSFKSRDLQTPQQKTFSARRPDGSTVKLNKFAYSIYTQLTEQTKTGDKFSIYVTVDKLRKPPAALAQYLATRGIDFDTFNSFLHINNMRLHNKPRDQITQAEYNQTIGITLLELEENNKENNQSMTKRIDDTFIPSSVIIISILTDLRELWSDRCATHPEISRENFPSYVGNFFDYISKSIKHSNDYNMAPYMTRVSRERVVAKAKLLAENNKSLTVSLAQQLAGQEFIDNLPDSYLELTAEKERNYFLISSEFHGKNEVKRRQNLLNQYNPNNSLTDLAIMTQKLQTNNNGQSQKPRIGISFEQASDQYPQLVDQMALSLNKNTGMPVETAKAKILTFERILNYAPPVVARYQQSQPVLDQYTHLLKDNPELGEMIQNLPYGLSRLCGSMLLAQSEAAEWLNVEKNENPKVTGARYLAQLSRDLPAMPISKMKDLFPEAFPSNRSDEESRDILLYNSLFYTRSWEMMHKVSDYVLNVEHKEEVHSNISTNIAKEFYLIGSLLYPDLDEDIEFLDNRADAINSRQDTFNYAVGSFTKDYFLDVLFLVRSSFKGGLKAGVKYGMTSRKFLKYYARMKQEIRKMKREGKSFEEINRAIIIKGMEIGLEFGLSKEAGNIMKGLTTAKNLPGTTANYLTNFTNLFTKVITKNTIRYKNSFLDCP